MLLVLHSGPGDVLRVGVAVDGEVELLKSLLGIIYLGPEVLPPRPDSHRGWISSGPDALRNAKVFDLPGQLIDGLVRIVDELGDGVVERHGWGVSSLS